VIGDGIGLLGLSVNVFIASWTPAVVRRKIKTSSDLHTQVFRRGWQMSPSPHPSSTTVREEIDHDLLFLTPCIDIGKSATTRVSHKPKNTQHLRGRIIEWYVRITLRIAFTYIHNIIVALGEYTFNMFTIYRICIMCASHLSDSKRQITGLTNRLHPHRFGTSHLNWACKE